MFRKSKVLEFTGARGVNNTKDPSLIRDDELQECVNFYVSNTGRLVARPGLSPVFSTPSPVKAVAKYNGSLYAVCDDLNIYKEDGSIVGQVE